MACFCQLKAALVSTDRPWQPGRAEGAAPPIEAQCVDDELVLMKVHVRISEATAIFRRFLDEESHCTPAATWRHNLSAVPSSHRGHQFL
mmetsp:Transcript_86156/g.278834  ORF Transcript_86156/g.278834 Transcript_86156/m.278834 type:complete len:89 (-) Transcript_86156:277-543(-)